MREQVPAALAGERLDRIVAMLGDVSRADAARLIDAGANLRALPLDCDHDAAGFAIESVAGMGVANVLDDRTNKCGDVYIGGRRDFTKDEDRAGGG